MHRPPRGIRNNNPGNIRKGGTPWFGRAKVQSDPDFCCFVAPEYGIRAIVLTLRTYVQKHKLAPTVEALINRWAPPVENNTNAYVSDVANRLGVKPSDELNLKDPATVKNLVAAIIAHENAGYTYAPEVIGRGVNMALGLTEA